ncbi:putative phosphoribosyl transferase [Hamadaea flava]|uniref:Dienelactone hydrolase family protein n=1 Tax=Hamadaea flava TaxID=1742688 RepID=A0ABV8LKC7_9ACTN|nr:hydrolase [Hamadaea flava]MCP2323884.1 putative phosphoribosyl transferase [Hamadaea flava]
MTEDVAIPLPTGQGEVAATLTVPDDPRGLVVFAHGSGSSRHSPRNRQVADLLQDRGHATLLLDLLTVAEEIEERSRFDIPLLAARLQTACLWVREEPALAPVRLGLFGASTGAAAALITAAEPGMEVAAVVSRGGRPDLAGPYLPLVPSPTLLIVGGDDPQVLDLNRQAAGLLPQSRLAIVPGATHLFEEPGALHQVAELAADWFTRHL